MLKTKISTTVTGQSYVKDAEGNDKVAVYMSTSIEESGVTSSNKTIQDQALYLANKKECRQDMYDYDDVVDAQMGGTTSEE